MTQPTLHFCKSTLTSGMNQTQKQGPSELGLWEMVTTQMSAMAWDGEETGGERKDTTSSQPSRITFFLSQSLTLKWPFYQFHSIFQFWRNRGEPPSWVDNSASSPVPPPVGLQRPREVGLARDYSIWSEGLRPPWGVCLHLLAVPPLLTLRFCLVRAYSVSRRRPAVLLSLWMGLWGPVSLWGHRAPSPGLEQRGTLFWSLSSARASPDGLASIEPCSVRRGCVWGACNLLGLAHGGW